MLRGAAGETPAGANASLEDSSALAPPGPSCLPSSLAPPGAARPQGSDTSQELRKQV